MKFKSLYTGLESRTIHAENGGIVTKTLDKRLLKYPTTFTFCTYSEQSLLVSHLVISPAMVLRSFSKDTGTEIKALSVVLTKAGRGTRVSDKAAEYQLSEAIMRGCCCPWNEHMSRSG